MINFNGKALGRFKYFFVPLKDPKDTTLFLHQKRKNGFMKQMSRKKLLILKNNA